MISWICLSCIWSNFFSVFNNQDSHSQTKNDETSGTEFPDENDSEDTKANKISAILNFMSQILPDDEIAEGMKCFTSKTIFSYFNTISVHHKWKETRFFFLNMWLYEVFDMIHAWAIEYVKYDGHDVKSVHIFLQGSGGTGKYYLMKIKTPYQKHCFIFVSTLKNWEFFTWTYRNITSNIGGTTIHFGRRIKS